MFKCILKQGHLLLGLLFLLQRNPKAVRGDTSPLCSAKLNECSYDSLPPVLGNGEANFAPKNICYNDHERVNVTCTGDLRGPPYNLCRAGYWLYPFGPTCEDITMCNTTGVPKHGSIHPDEVFFDLYERIYYSCNDKYSLVGPSEAVCESGGVWNPTTVPTCKADCPTPVLDNGKVSPDTPTVRNGEVITFECSKNFTKAGLSVTTCRDGHFDPPELPVCYADCPRLSETFHNGARTGDSAPYTKGDEVYYKCNPNFILIGSAKIICQHSIWSDREPVCKENCWVNKILNSDCAFGYKLSHNETLRITCNTGYSTGVSQTTDLSCNDGILSPPELPECFAQCNRPIIPNSDATSSSPALHHGEQFILTCNTGYSTWQSQSSTSMCTDGKLKPDVPLCYAQCDRPVIPNSDSTSSVPVLHNGDKITVTCDDGYSYGKSKKTTSVCDHGRLDPAIPSCYAQCSRPVIPNSDATSSNPVLNHGDVIIVKCNSGYSNGNSQSSSSVCSYGSLSPTVPLCYAQCNRPVIANSDASSPYPLLDHGEALTITCDTGYSNGQSRSMTTVCLDGIINPALQFCYAQCSRKVIPNSDSSSSSPPIHHGDVLIVTCNEGYSGGQGNSTSSSCSNGTFSPPLPSCYADCKSLTNPDYGEVVIGSNPYSHREVAVFECNENYTLVGNKEIYCYDGLWDKDPPDCMAHCSRPVIPNSDAMSPNPHVPHGTAITVTCNGGYTNGDTARTIIICDDGTISPDKTKCIEKKLENQDIAAIVLGVLVPAGGIVAFIVGLIWKKLKKDKDLAAKQQRADLAAKQQRADLAAERQRADLAEQQQRADAERLRADLAEERQRADAERLRADLAEERQRADLAEEQQRADAERERADLAAERQRAAEEQQRADLAVEQRRTDAERERADAERERAAEERQRADAERERADAERERAAEERQRAAAERQRAAAERQQADLAAVRQRADDAKRQQADLATERQRADKERERADAERERADASFCTVL